MQSHQGGSNGSGPTTNGSSASHPQHHSLEQGQHTTSLQYGAETGLSATTGFGGVAMYGSHAAVSVAPPHGRSSPLPSLASEAARQPPGSAPAPGGAPQPVATPSYGAHVTQQPQHGNQRAVAAAPSAASHQAYPSMSLPPTLNPSAAVHPPASAFPSTAQPAAHFAHSHVQSHPHHLAGSGQHQATLYQQHENPSSGLRPHAQQHQQQQHQQQHQQQQQQQHQQQPQQPPQQPSVPSHAHSASQQQRSYAHFGGQQSAFPASSHLAAMAAYGAPVEQPQQHQAMQHQQHQPLHHVQHHQGQQGQQQLLRQHQQQQQAQAWAFAEAQAARIQQAQQQHQQLVQEEEEEMDPASAAQLAATRKRFLPTGDIPASVSTVLDALHVQPDTSLTVVHPDLDSERPYRKTKLPWPTSPLNESEEDAEEQFALLEQAEKAAEEAAALAREGLDGFGPRRSARPRITRTQSRALNERERVKHEEEVRERARLAEEAAAKARLEVKLAHCLEGEALEQAQKELHANWDFLVVVCFGCTFTAEAGLADRWDPAKLEASLFDGDLDDYLPWFICCLLTILRGKAQMKSWERALRTRLASDPLHRATNPMIREDWDILTLADKVRVLRALVDWVCDGSSLIRQAVDNAMLQDEPYVPVIEQSVALTQRVMSDAMEPLLKRDADQAPVLPTFPAHVLTTASEPVAPRAYDPSEARAVLYTEPRADVGAAYYGAAADSGKPPLRRKRPLRCQDVFDINRLRFAPIGRDAHGRAYWCFGPPYLYREVPAQAALDPVTHEDVEYWVVPENSAELYSSSDEEEEEESEDGEDDAEEEDEEDAAEEDDEDAKEASQQMKEEGDATGSTEESDYASSKGRRRSSRTATRRTPRREAKTPNRGGDDDDDDDGDNKDDDTATPSSRRSARLRSSTGATTPVTTPTSRRSSRRLAASSATKDSPPATSGTKRSRRSRRLHEDEEEDEAQSPSETHASHESPRPSKVRRRSTRLTSRSSSSRKPQRETSTDSSSSNSQQRASRDVTPTAWVRRSTRRRQSVTPLSIGESPSSATPSSRRRSARRSTRGGGSEDVTPVRRSTRVRRPARRRPSMDSDDRSSNHSSRRSSSRRASQGGRKSRQAESEDEVWYQDLDGDEVFGDDLDPPRVTRFVPGEPTRVEGSWERVSTTLQDMYVLVSTLRSDPVQNDDSRALVAVLHHEMIPKLEDEERARLRQERRVRARRR